MLVQETASDLAIKICERLGIHYHVGNGVSTVDGVPYDYEKPFHQFSLNNYSATLQIAAESQTRRKDISQYDRSHLTEKDVFSTTIHSTNGSTSYQISTTVPLVAA